MIEFDPKKAKANIEKHGINFTDVEPVFFDPRAMTIEVTRNNEVRKVTVGTDALGRVIAVVWVMRGSSFRIISARASRTEERKAYDS